MAISLPSRTAAIIPHPHEQKLQEVVNSLTLESFNSSVAALTAVTSISPSTARPIAPPTLAFIQSLRLTGFRVSALSLLSDWLGGIFSFLSSGGISIGHLHLASRNDSVQAMLGRTTRDRNCYF